MWLSTSIYERVPQIWLVLGILFFAYSFYDGLDQVLSLVWIVTGLICCVYGIGIAIVRSRHRNDNLQNDESTATSR